MNIIFADTLATLDESFGEFSYLLKLSTVLSMSISKYSKMALCPSHELAATLNPSVSV